MFNFKKLILEYRSPSVLGQYIFDSVQVEGMCLGLIYTEIDKRIRIGIPRIIKEAPEGDGRGPGLPDALALFLWAGG